MVRCSYYVFGFTDDRVFVIDNDVGMSLTNDAENVIKELNMIYGDRRVIYRDTCGRWDEMVHSRGKFVEFAPYFEELPG